MLVNLQKRLRVWREHEIISERELQKILEFERSQYSRSWVSFGIAGIGVIALVTGVISIIASNWEHFGNVMKIGGYFLLQGAAGAVFIKHEQRTGLVREVALATFALLFWAGIGLFGQIYNLSGTWWQAMLFWVCLALPAAIYSNSKMLCSVWCVTVLATSVVWCGEFLLEGPRLSEAQNLWFLGVVAATATILATFGLGASGWGLIREPLRYASITLGLGFLLIVGTPFASSAWKSLMWRHSIGWQGAFPLIANVQALLLPWSAFASAVLVSLNCPQLSSPVRKATAALFLALAVYLSVPFLVPLSAIFPPVAQRFLGAAAFIAVWTAAAAAAATASMKRMFEIASFVIAIRFIVIYFEVFRSLSTTGIGLIISGAVIIGVAILWNRGCRTVTSKFGGEV